MYLYALVQWFEVWLIFKGTAGFGTEIDLENLEQ